MRQYLLPFHQHSSEASVNGVNGTQHMVDTQRPQATLVTIILRVMLLYIIIIIDIQLHYHQEEVKVCGHKSCQQA